MPENNFDLLNSPLDDTNLIEASAGTGKTFTITGLFLRLLLEKGLLVENILVVTFTEAATQELKERIRTRLRQAIEAFSKGVSQDPFLSGLVKRDADTKRALKSLRDAIRSFDQAAIFTIHGFCRRMLVENAFESGSLFDTELITNQEDLIRKIVDDFWRKHFYEQSVLFLNYVMAKKLSPENFSSLLREAFQPDLKIIPELDPPDSSDTLEKDFRKAYEAVSTSWELNRTDIENILISHKGLNRTKYKKANILVWISRMDDYLASQHNNVVLFSGFEKFTSSVLQGSVKKNHTAPDHPFFDCCEALKESSEQLVKLFQDRITALKKKLFVYVQNELAVKKQEKNVQYFDDLLLKLHKALNNKGGERLADEIRKRFKAALIDEFQDTDPVQYAIFNTVFARADNSILFLIGDPKQAIYGFRGADIFAYMDAAKHVTSRYTLKTNWRSDPRLVEAVNTLFENADTPFVYREIPFYPALGTQREGFESLRINGKEEPPLQLWYLDAGKITGQGKPLSKSVARDRIVMAVSDQISRLLNFGVHGKAYLGDRPLKQGDIAVLVRRNAEADKIRKALTDLNINSVVYSTENIFDSSEALEMEILLSGILNPGNEARLKAALATDMMGLSGEELESLTEDEIAWEEWLVKFKEYHDLWSGHGFIRMFKHLIKNEKILSRLMAFSDGERRSTNLLHLSEILHQAGIEKKMGMPDLLKWLSRQRDPGSPRLEEHQLRLESDENAVKIVTMHKSKGMEYPVVFCPFTWSSSRITGRKDHFTFHDEHENMRLTLDIGSDNMDKNIRFAERELLAENLRLMYVALTRAKNRCYLVWGRFSEAESSAPAYLFHQAQAEDAEDRVGSTCQRFKTLSDQDLLKELNFIKDKSHGSIIVSELPEDQGEKYLQPWENTGELICREFSGKIDQTYRISSFSSLVSGRGQLYEPTDYDEKLQINGSDRNAFEIPSGREELEGIFSFPRGARAGTFMHDIFEHLDFTQKDTPLMENLVVAKLEEHGFEASWKGIVCDMVQNVLSVSLEPDNKGFTLSCVRSNERLNEMEFYFPLKLITPKKLKNIFAKYAGFNLSEVFPDRIEKLDFEPVKGFMRGFVDLIFKFADRFYIVDWKSNFLGGRGADYNQNALNKAMADEFYILQYHIYAAALNRYLHKRLPGYTYEKHFGGVYYIFLRGVDSDKGPDYGIYRARPTVGLINELCEGLI